MKMLAKIVMVCIQISAACSERAVKSPIMRAMCGGKSNAMVSILKWCAEKEGATKKKNPVS